MNFEHNPPPHNIEYDKKKEFEKNNGQKKNIEWFLEGSDDYDFDLEDKSNKKDICTQPNI